MTLKIFTWVGFDDAGDGTCMGCGREKDECYCGLIRPW